MFRMKKNFEVLILFLILFIPSLRVIFKYLPHPQWISVFIASIQLFFYFFLLRSQIVNKLFNKTASLGFVLIMILIFIISNYYIYPIADARKLIGKGSTGDDAIIEPAKQFLSSGDMYNVTLQGAVPVSPGPGWILLNSVFVYSDAYFLFTPTYIFVSILLHFFIFRRRTAPIYLLTLLSTSLIFWELMVTGHDLISIGFSFTAIIMLIYRYCIETGIKTFSIPILLISILIGVISTSRIVFIFLPFLTGLLIYKYNLKCALYVLIISLSTAIFLHAVFYFNTNGFYQPLHLFNKGESHVGLPIIMTGVSFTFVLAIIASFNIEKSFESVSKWFFILLIIPLSFISFGEFLYVDKNFAAWEGANYIVPSVPVYLIYLSSKSSAEVPSFGQRDHQAKLSVDK